MTYILMLPAMKTQPTIMLLGNLTLLLPFTLISLFATKLAEQGACRYIPGDAGWPTEDQWNNLNATVHGRLIATRPLARVCHDPTYSATACAELKAQWGIASVAVSEPAEFLLPYYQNQSCDPFTPRQTPCTLGNYASYSIDIGSPEDIAAGIQFAEHTNIRLTIKNTGHDFLGKSTGKGALSLWTHNLETLELLPSYNSSFYTGPALKMGAGVQGANAASFASKHGYRLVIGSCPSVGLAGGYAQGGGHSFLSGLYGLAADNVLEWEVVTPDGRHLVATPNQNTDLYFALSGGGGGTYAVVVSMTMRVFKDGPIGGVSFSFSSFAAGGDENFWGAIEVFHAHLQPLVDNGGISAQYLMSKKTFSVLGMMAPNRTSSELVTLLNPMMLDLKKYYLTPESMGLTRLDTGTFYQYYTLSIGALLDFTPTSGIVSGRMISRENMAVERMEIIEAFRKATHNEHIQLYGIAFNGEVGKIVPPVARNSVQPAWRRVLTTFVIEGLWDWYVSWDEMLRRQAEIYDVITPAMVAATPDSGTYLNEASFQEAHWQDEFYGPNYAELKRIKDKYDPDGILYGVTAVGSEHWAPDQEGRLCKTSPKHQDEDL